MQICDVLLAFTVGCSRCCENLKFGNFTLCTKLNKRKRKKHARAKCASVLIVFVKYLYKLPVMYNTSSIGIQERGHCISDPEL